MKHILEFTQFIEEALKGRYIPGEHKSDDPRIKKIRQRLEKKYNSIDKKIKQHWKEFELKSVGGKFKGGDHVVLNQKGKFAVAEEGVDPDEFEKIRYGIIRYAGDNHVRVDWHYSMQEVAKIKNLRDKWAHDEIKKIRVKGKDL